MLGIESYGSTLGGGEYDFSVQEEVPARSESKGDDLGEQGVNSRVYHEADHD